jgi:hypothetical protein
MLLCLAAVMRLPSDQKQKGEFVERGVGENLEFVVESESRTALRSLLCWTRGSSARLVSNESMMVPSGSIGICDSRYINECQFSRNLEPPGPSPSLPPARVTRLLAGAGEYARHRRFVSLHFTVSTS